MIKVNIIYTIVLANMFFLASPNLSSSRAGESTGVNCTKIAECAQKLVNIAKRLKEDNAALADKVLKLQAQLVIIEKEGGLNTKGEVIAFNAMTCPLPWILYTAAQGRFIRGIDETGTAIDPSGIRQPGSLQADGLIAHAHTVGDGSTDTTTDTGGTPARLPSYIHDHFGSGPQLSTSSVGISETRPRNVALLYCILP